MHICFQILPRAENPRTIRACVVASGRPIQVVRTDIVRGAQTAAGDQGRLHG